MSNEGIGHQICPINGLPCKDGLRLAEDTDMANERRREVNADLAGQNYLFRADLKAKARRFIAAHGGEAYDPRATEFIQEQADQIADTAGGVRLHEQRVVCEGRTAILRRCAAKTIDIA
jgi:hypothetical protein